MFGFFSKGKIDIKLEKYQFVPGDTIKGSLVLKLKKPVEASGVEIQLLGTKTVIRGYGQNRRRNKETIFDFSQPLDGAKLYSSGEAPEYSFEITIPEDILSKPEWTEGVVGSVMKAATIISGSSSRVDWYIIGRLNIPKKIDVSKKLKINIT